MMMSWLLRLDRGGGLFGPWRCRDFWGRLSLARGFYSAPGAFLVTPSASRLPVLPPSAFPFSLLHLHPSPLSCPSSSNSPSFQTPLLPQSGVFGLGAPELAIIAGAAAVLLGPSKLASFSKDLGKVAGELKEVPKEFQKGIAEGEIESKAIKAKIMAEVKAELAEEEEAGGKKAEEKVEEKSE